MADDINLELIFSGDGTAEHKRELYKLLALAGIQKKDLKDEQTKEIVQDFLTEMIVATEQTEDQLPEIDGNDIDFTTRYLITRNVSVYSKVNTIRKQSYGR